MIIGTHECIRLLQVCKDKQDIRLGRQIHLVLFKSGLLVSSLFWANRLLQIYARYGRKEEFPNARRLFDEMPVKNCFSWNTLIGACFDSCKTEVSLQLFNLTPMKNTFSWNLMISSLTKNGDLIAAHKLFEEMPVKEAVACNCVMHGYIRHDRPKEALRLFKLMNTAESSWKNDKYLMATALSACARALSYNLGRQIHARVLVEKMDLDSALGSSLADMYGKCGDLGHALRLIAGMPEPDEFSLSSLLLGYAAKGRLSDARKLFREKENPSVILWNSLLTAYLSNGNVTETRELFKEMTRKGVAPDSSSLTTVLSACATTWSNTQIGEQLHGRTIRSGLIADVTVTTALVDLYSKAGSFDKACRVFDEAKYKDTVLLNSMITVYSNSGKTHEAKKLFKTIQNKTLISWNSMLVCYSRNGFPLRSLELFSEMHRSGIKLDRVSLASGISACASVSFLRFGEQLFALSETLGLVQSDGVISTSLIDLYCKCGSIRVAGILFRSMESSDEAAWNSMLMGYASNGCGLEALDLFESMKRENLAPNEVSFLAVLAGCCHCGLVEEGRRQFVDMQEQFKIAPTVEHYSCMVDLLVRAGKLGEALEFIEGMPFEPDATILTSLLRGCQEQGEEFLGKKVAERLMAIDPSQPGVYLQLSTMYAGRGMWDKSLEFRRILRQKEIVKNPGISWLDQ